ncbi:helix-turn-helix transcriptional regulator [Streptomyces sp. NPDC088733]|uniref:helix-turn-helix transcriptional regulator n=1 Tax=Streptomyces sp. NPDC088733 TaxID=3365880 RepID=UPI0037FF52D2
MRASRLVSLLLLLQARGRLTAQQLADELEVSVRTIYRDVQSLHEAGIPLYGDAGPEGGYRLVDGYRTRLTGLTAEETRAWFLAALPDPAAQLGLGEAAAAARLKFSAALPPALRESAERIRERFHLDAPGWYSPGEETPHLPAVADAVWNRQAVRVRYRRWREPAETERRLEPYGLVLKAGRWYVVARGAGGLRTYRVDQILAVDVLGEAFEPEPGFDLTAYWRAYLADFHARLHQGEALIRVSPRGAERLPSLLSHAVARAVAERGEPDADGWVRALVPIESVGHAHGEFLRLGPDLEVLEPVALRALLIGSARGLAALYGAG